MSRGIDGKELILSFAFQAASLRIAEQYIQAFSNIAKEVVAYKLIDMQVPVLHNLFTLKLVLYLFFTFSSGHDNVAS